MGQLRETRHGRHSLPHPIHKRVRVHHIDGYIVSVRSTGTVLYARASVFIFKKFFVMSFKL